MRKALKLIFGTLCSYSIIILPFFCLGQKLPNIQKGSMLIPKDIQIDGKIHELKDQLMAYNRNVGISYTIASDSVSLYFAVQTSNPIIMLKIIQGGIQIAARSSNQVQEKDLPFITFPFISESGKNSLFLTLKRQQAGIRANRRTLADSLDVVLNRQLTFLSKEIKISGIKSISDTLISVYNDQNIKAKGFFEKGTLTYEFLIPLKSFGLSANPAKIVGYRIQLNGQSSIINSGLSADGLVTVTTVRDNGNSSNSELEYPTFFWGTYSLVK